MGKYKRMFSKYLSSHEVVSLPGYDKARTEKSRADVIYNDSSIRKKRMTSLVGYSYSATTILFSDELANCKANIILVNPFLKPKSNTIKILRDNLSKDFDTTT